MAPEGPGRWAVRDYGMLRTMRFDEAGLEVDLAQSRNVVGYGRTNGSLYVFLGDGGEARIALAEEPRRAPHLEYCGCLVQRRQVEGGTQVFSVEARLDTTLRLADVAPGAAVAFRTSGPKEARGTGSADPQGRVSIVVPKGTRTVEVRTVGQ